jgi:hypothetical protein
LIEPDRFLLRLADLVDAAGGSKLDDGGIRVELAVLGLASIGNHRDCLVPDILCLVDRPCFCKRAAGLVV